MKDILGKWPNVNELFTISAHFKNLTNSFLILLDNVLQTKTEKLFIFASSIRSLASELNIQNMIMETDDEKLMCIHKIFECQFSESMEEILIIQVCIF